MTMKLLLIGDAKDTFLFNLCLYLKKNYSDIHADILNTNPSLSYKEIEDISECPYENIIQYYGNRTILSTIPKIRGVIAYLNKLKSNSIISKSKYDIVYFAGLFPNHLQIVSQNKKNVFFKIASLYGSDFYNLSTSLEYKQLQQAFNDLDRLIIATNKMESDILSKIEVNSNKIRRCIFGLEPLEYLANLEETTSKEAKVALKVDENTLVITCGYNANGIQQHFEIIKTINEIKNQLPANYILWFPMTYGGSPFYKTEVKNALNESGLKFQMFESFMSDKEVALLRKATDIFIQIQKNDASSGSMREHLFCRNIVITGDWLPYQDFLNNGIKFQTIASPQDLGKKLVYVLENKEAIQFEINRNNTSDKFNESRWPVCIKDWHAVLNEYKTKCNEY